MRNYQGNTMRNIFKEIGKTESEINAKLDKAFAQLFEGNRETETVCFDANDKMSYIVDIAHDDIRSEGMSYGMTIAALMKKPELFKKLWNFAKEYMLNKKGPWARYFSWQVSTKDFSMMDPGSAPDGEEYFAAALLFAAKNFKSEEYMKDALEVIDAMAHKPQDEYVHTMMDVDAGLVRFSPNNGNDFTDPSYNTVGFYRMYGKASGDSLWNTIAKNSIEYLKKAMHPVTGLAADYSEYDGTPRPTPWYPESGCFSGDSWRTIWNVAFDAATIDSSDLAETKEWEIFAVRRMLNFFNTNRPYLSDMQIDGGAFPREPRTMALGHVAMNAAATVALPEGDPLIKPFAEDLWNMEIPNGEWRYYDGLLYMLGLLACSGKFFV